MKNLPKGARRLCGALLELSPTGNGTYDLAINAARLGVGSEYAKKAEPARQNLIKAVELNVVNQKKYPYEHLKRKYGLIETRESFAKEKDLYCERIMEKLKITKMWVLKK